MKSVPFWMTILVVAGCQSKQIDLTGPNLPPAESARFSRDIGPLLTRSCGDAECHGADGASGVRVGSYTALMSSFGRQYSRAVVTAGDAEDSPLVDKLEPGPRFGMRMPLGRQPLTSAEINSIRAWINRGAAND